MFIGGAANFADTLQFSKTDPSLPDQFPVSINLSFSGILNAAATDFASATLDLNLVFVFAQFLSIQDTSSGGFVISNPAGFGGTNAVAAGASGFTTVLTTATQTISVGARSFSMALNATAGSRGPSGSATSDFSHTLAFPTGVDVFNLPPGYSVDAGDYLVNNRFLDPSVSPIPEPASWALLLAGLLASRLVRRSQS